MNSSTPELEPRSFNRKLASRVSACCKSLLTNHCRLASRSLTTLLLATLAISPLHATNLDEIPDSTWRALQEGKAVALMRHALAPGVGDPEDFDVGDCSTQRNLSAEGKLQAEAVGQQLRDKGISSASVVTSAWCRCVETAKLLGFDQPQVNTALNSVFRRSSNTSVQTELIEQSIKQWITEDIGTKILVTHQVNIRALTGFSTGSGDIQIVTLKNDELVVLDTFRAPVAR